MVVGVEHEGVPSSKARGRTTRGEEDLVRGLTHVIAVDALKLAKGPDEVGVTVVVVGTGCEKGAAEGLAARVVMRAHSSEGGGG